jgi:hypothetical protein
MEHLYLFLGSRLQYWQVLFAEWQRLSASLGSPPFEFDIPSLGSSPPSASFVPPESEEFWINFHDERHCAVISICASAEPGASSLFLTAYIQPEALEPPSASAYALWKDLKGTLLEKGWLRDPSAHYAPHRPPRIQDRVQEAIQHLHRLRSEALRAGRLIPKKAAAMDQVGITPKTWRRHAPELWAHWDDVAYKE